MSLTRISKRQGRGLVIIGQAGVTCERNYPRGAAPAQKNRYAAKRSGFERTTFLGGERGRGRVLERG